MTDTTLTRITRLLDTEVLAWQGGDCPRDLALDVLAAASALQAEVRKGRQDRDHARIMANYMWLMDEWAPSAEVAERVCARRQALPWQASDGWTISNEWPPHRSGKQQP